MLTNTDLTLALKENNKQIFAKTKTDLTLALKENNKQIEAKIEKAIIDNNDKLFDKLASKQDVKQAIADNNHELLRHLVSKDELYQNFATKDDLRESFNTLQVTLDRIYGIVKKMDEEQTVISHKVQNHEGRITKLEVSLA